MKYNGLIALLCCLLLGACSSDKTTVVESAPQETEQPPFTFYADGTSSGGGGDVVVCYNKNNEIIDMQAYDLWVTPQLYKLTFPIPKLGTADHTASNKTDYIDHAMGTLRNLAKLDIAFAGEIADLLHEFAPRQIETSEYIHKVSSIAVTKDNGAILIPEASSECAKITYERMFWQVDQPKPFQYTFVLSEKLWKVAPESVKATVVLHEIILLIERHRFDPIDSLNSQYYNAVIHSNEFNSFSAVDYIDVLLHQMLPDGKAWANVAASPHDTSREVRTYFSVNVDGIYYKVNANLRLDSVYFYESFNNFAENLLKPEQVYLFGGETKGDQVDSEYYKEILNRRPDEPRP